MKVLVLGASGMLGNAVFRLFAESPGFDVMGAVRSPGSLRLLPDALAAQVISGVDVEQVDSLTLTFAQMRPDVVINCIGVVKQIAEADDPLTAIPINSLLPHRLARLCDVAGARLVHVSTDCVFSGTKGMYIEADTSDAKDLYGRSKYLGEVDYPHAITLRTSIIGHELARATSLIGWFLAQKVKVKGFTKAIFSGLPTVELARVIRDYVIPYPELRGLYHVSAKPINKYDLLNLVAQAYGKEIEIEPDATLIIDRSLDSTRFTQATGYQSAEWPELVRRMREFG
ncbi:dTDP-4-dehydrorhamnose reductase family protein [Ralstonia mojiangensis]|uniref:dTDP-4-dehydrorhamnose reductase n=1 Tax=Ralstonia mojiangensis TaxID=2953895 RepID=A0ABT2L4Q4_9RALS|nr:SDR family oxidoreductase [Ralstonia mojiangensis]MCT7297522.1 SDR family oxidoreductase [Ralstonia mojiangensis]MCT7310114.1 SDR family oxidoreductase [Ralstonia mojiangensis]